MCCAGILHVQIANGRRLGVHARKVAHLRASTLLALALFEPKAPVHRHTLAVLCAAIVVCEWLHLQEPNERVPSEIERIQLVSDETQLVWQGWVMSEIKCHNMTDADRIPFLC